MPTSMNPIAPLSPIEVLPADVSESDAFAGDGTSLRLRHKARMRDDRYQRRFAAATHFLADIAEGQTNPYELRRLMSGETVLNLARYGLQETMTSGDFTNLFGDILDRRLLDQYNTVPPSWRQYCSVENLADFRTANRFTLSGLRQPLNKVAQQSGYDSRNVRDGKYTIALSKWGTTVPIDWESIINDDLNAFLRIPNLMVDSVANTEEQEVAKLICDSSGFLTSVFSNANGNIVNTTNGASSTNPALSTSGIQDAFTVLMSQVEKDANGNTISPIALRGAILLVPQHLAIPAQNFVTNLTQITIGATGSSSASNVVAYTMPEWLKNLRVAVNYYLPLVNTTAGKTTWYLIADPTNTRPCLTVANLRGRSAPELFQREANARRLGGGALDPMEGSFENDTVEYKLRHVFGTTVMDPKGIVVSNGTGS